MRIFEVGREEAAATTATTTANASQHLQKMVREGLVAAERKGISRYYCLRSLAISEVWESLQDLAQALDPSLEKEAAPLADGGLHSSESLGVIRQNILDNKAILLDVRTDVESKATPIPSALAIPENHLRQRLHELPKTKSIYVVCRGRYCITATYAVRYLRRRGFRAYRLPHSSARLAKGFRIRSTD